MSGIIDQILHDANERTLVGRKALITGASSGIGLACAVQLANAGVAGLFLVARRQDRLLEHQAALRKRFPQCNVVVISGDVRDSRCLEEVEQNGGCDVDIFVNNAGLALGKELVQDAQLSDWTTMIETNVTSAIIWTQKVLQHMLQRPFQERVANPCDIIFMGSVAGHEIYDGGSVYCASKHAIHAFARSLRQECCDRFVRCTVIAPGMVSTEFSKVRFHGDDAKASAVYAKMQPLTASDIARQVLFALRQPAHVNLNEIWVMPTQQGSISKVHRFT